MTSLAALWLPIVLSTVFVFIASSIIHMVLPWHKSDWAGLPDEAGFRRLVGPMAIPPGDYTVPHCGSMKEMGSEAFQAKMNEGPVMIVTVRPNRQAGMAPMFVGWTIAVLVASLIAACVAATTMAPGAAIEQVWHTTGLVAFGIYGFGGWPESIWYGRKVSTAIKNTVDALIYAVVTALTFGWFWPAV
ncbi:MAG TPA: hypothetical protein VFN22_07070 [Gemmatimonadales bacterium]|nr:hypothetical protein [Gemmatimonadales bacterium]